MKILTWCKVIVSGCLSLTVLFLAIQAKHGDCISSEKQQFKLKKLKNENDIVKDATKRIKDSLKKSKHSSCIRCTYTLAGQNTISTTTKVYYDEYRKRPDYFSECYLHESVPADKVVEVYYKKNDKSLSLSFKNSKHKEISSKKVKIADALAA